MASFLHQIIIRWGDESVRLLIVFAKTPVAGQVKTRLGAVVGPDQAAEIYEHLLETCITASATNDLWQQVIAITPESDKAYFEQRGLEIMRQSGTDLGERMSNALAQVLSAARIRS